MNKYIILYLEGYTEPVKVKIEEVRNDIYEDIHEKKLRLAMAQEFDRMKDEAGIDNFLAGTAHAPQKKNQTTVSRSGSKMGGVDPARRARRLRNHRPIAAYPAHYANRPAKRSARRALRRGADASQLARN